MAETQDGATSTELVPADTDTTVSAPVPEGERKVKKIIRRKRRPARPQVDPSEVKSEAPPQTGIVFNIWYNKWSGGDREDKYLSQTHAKGRCVIATDAGYTTADKVTGSYFCLFFARGLCPKGQDCEYLHRLPGIHDHFNPNIDAFGRDKHSEYRDDMGGVGSFLRQNRTLYIGRIFVTDDIEEVVARHFQEWGEIERVRVLTARGVAFVTYMNEANAQFAKEAMAHQSLDHEEILNVRWATQDPNPLSQKREARRVEEQAAEAIRRALPAEFIAELEGRDSSSVKRQRTEAEYGLEGYDAPDDVWYGRARAIEQSEKQTQLEAPEEKKLLEAAPAQETAPTAEQRAPGLIGGNTAAAFKRFAASNTAQPAQVIKPSGPLVGYGSDDDSD